MVVEEYHKKIMNGNVTFVGLNFQERVEEEHLKKEGNNGEDREHTRARSEVWSLNTKRNEDENEKNRGKESDSPPIY